MHDKKILRVIDVNFNRAKEGLRVVEDILRFIFEDDSLRKKLRKYRHDLDIVATSKALKNAVRSRDSIGDLGRNADKLEVKRKNSEDILYANLQRVKESLRVLEEFLKIIAKNNVGEIKKIRYHIYELEKTILIKWPTKISLKKVTHV